MLVLFFLINVVALVLTYALLCNTAYVTKNDRCDGKSYLERKYVVPDLIQVYRDWITLLCVLILLYNPVTFLFCVCIWVFVCYGYLRGQLEVFGRNNGV